MHNVHSVHIAQRPQCAMLRCVLEAQELLKIGSRAPTWLTTQRCHTMSYWYQYTYWSSVSLSSNHNFIYNPKCSDNVDRTECKGHTGHDVSFRSVLGSVSLSSSHNSTDYPKCSDTVDGTETGGNTKQWARCQNRKGLFQIQIQIKMQIQIQQWVRCQDRKGLFHLSWSSVIWIGCAKDQAFLFMFLFLFLVKTKKVYFIFHKVLLFGCDISHAFLFIQAASLRKMLSVGSQWD